MTSLKHLFNPRGCMTSSIVINDLNKHVRHIVIDRIDAKNALTAEMYLNLADKLNEADSEPQIRAVVISGDEKVFCAGNDLNDFLERPPLDGSAPPFVFLLALNNFSKPLIAATAGPAVGIGTTMLLHCDHVISADNTLFKMPFVALGLTPEGGSSLLLPHLIGQRLASELLLLGKSFDAQYAHNIGLINHVCKPHEVIDLAIKKANQYAAQAPVAVQRAKELLKAPFKAQIEQVIKDEGEIFAQRVKSAECKEAISAFFEKRAPNFG